MNWKEAENYNKQVLDKLSIEKFMTHSQNIEDLMDTLQQVYGDDLEDDAILQGELFNLMDREDFVDYLKNRYKARVCEWTTTTYELVEWDNGTNE